MESALFEQMSDLLNKALHEKGNVPASLRRDLICRTEALQTTLCQHLSKEEQQVRIKSSLSSLRMYNELTPSSNALVSFQHLHGVNQLLLAMVYADQLKVGKSIETAGFFGGLLLFSGISGLSYSFGYILVLNQYWLFVEYRAC